MSGEASILTAQIAMPEEESAAVYAADSRYTNGTRNLGRITIASDNVFGDNTEGEIAQQLMALVGDPQSGYEGTVTIPIDLNAERPMSAPPAGGPGGEPPALPAS